jgi:hypothetical protein
MDVNWIAVLAAGVSAFLLGGIWYSPALFGKAWQRLNGLSDEALAQRSLGLVFGGGLVLSLIAAFVFAMFLGPDPGVAFASSAGLAAGLAWVAASYGITYLFEARPLGLWLINGGYHTAQFTLYGAILGWLG